MFEEEIKSLLKKAGIKEIGLETPPTSDFGDIAFPCFNLAKIEKRNPKEIAEDIAKRIKIPKDSLILKIEAKVGYVNFFYNYEKLSGIVLKEIIKEKEKFGKPEKTERKRIMVEFSQPNTVHGMHIGHGRTTLLGESLARILKFYGHDVIKANYPGDIGLQVAKVCTAYLHWGKGKKPDKKPDLWLWDFYTKYHEEAEKHPELDEEAREFLKKWESGDKKTITVWKMLRDLCVEGFKQTYKRLNVTFDVWFWESEVSDLGKTVVEEALKKKVAIKDDTGAIIVPLEKYGLPDKVMLRADETGVYFTRDLGLATSNFKKFKLDSRIYVVAAQQSLYFKQLFKTLELLGFKWAKNLHHLVYEMVNLPEGKMSSRLGRVVKLDEFIDEIVDLAAKEVEKRNPKLDEKSKKKIAESVGLGALKFALLKIEPGSVIIFNKEDVVQFQGDTGPYLQYACTRCAGILRKAGKWKPNFKAENLSEEEKVLANTLMRFPDVIEQSVRDFKPHYICNYAYELATAFDKFYEANPVLKAESKDKKNFRLALVQATEIVLKNSLGLLGIEALEKM